MAKILVATFPDTEHLLSAVRKARREMFRVYDVFTPFPVHGLDEALVSEADLVWSLGKGTLPHQLARVVALEQLYRAFAFAAIGFATLLGGCGDDPPRTMSG